MSPTPPRTTTLYQLFSFVSRRAQIRLSTLGSGFSFRVEPPLVVFVTFSFFVFGFFFGFIAARLLLSATIFLYVNYDA